VLCRRCNPLLRGKIGLATPSSTCAKARRGSSRFGHRGPTTPFNPTQRQHRQICRSGALTGASYRSGARRSTCSRELHGAPCASGCSPAGRTGAGGRSPGAPGRVRPAVNEEWVCDKGGPLGAFTIRHQGRTGCCRRMGRNSEGSWLRASWPEALNGRRWGCGEARDGEGVGVLPGWGCLTEGGPLLATPSSAPAYALGHERHRTTGSPPRARDEEARVSLVQRVRRCCARPP